MDFHIQMHKASPFLHHMRMSALGAQGWLMNVQLCPWSLKAEGGTLPANIFGSLSQYEGKECVLQNSLQEQKVINKQCDLGSLDFSRQEMSTLEDTKVLKY